jgi:hypothetical protein
MFHLKKISNDRKEEIPNPPIPEGYVADHKNFVMPEVGKPFLFNTLLTTLVVNILEREEGYIKFKTLNSTYLLTYE